MQRYSIRHLVLVAVFAAVLCVLSLISIPLPSGVPVTMQTFGVALCGFVLGPRYGTLSVVVYLLLGAIGLPVFSGFQGGIGVFFGVTGGFMFGFCAMAPLCGQRSAVCAALGLIVCHLAGVLQFSWVAATPILRSIALVSLPYLVKDALSVIGAHYVARAVRKGLIAARLTVG